MRLDEELYRGFLQELDALRRFRQSYAPGGVEEVGPLKRRDPDVERIVEAVALFAARSRLAGERSLLATRRRLAQQQFSFLLAPGPARATLRLVPQGKQLADGLTIPRHARVQLRSLAAAGRPEGFATHDPPGVFRTVQDLRFLPIALRAVEQREEEDGWQLLFRFRATIGKRNEHVGRLSLWVDTLEDYPSSARVHQTLAELTRDAVLRFEVEGEERVHPRPVPVRFGAPGPAPDPERDGTLHPLASLRAFFHYPEQELYIDFDVPDVLPANWTEFTLGLRLRRPLPAGARPSARAFLLHCVPIENLQASLSTIIRCDGTQSRYRIAHPQADLGYELHTLRGVYKDVGRGLQPVLPGILGLGGTTPTAAGEEAIRRRGWEVEHAVERDGRRLHWLVLRAPEAFLDGPVQLLAEGLWTQPRFRSDLDAREDVTLADMALPGVRWELRAFAPYAECALRDDVDGLLEALSLQMKALLDRAELRRFLGDYLGASASVFGQFLAAIDDVVHTTEAVFEEGAATTRAVYRLGLEQIDPRLTPLLEILLAKTSQALAAWSPNPRVALVARLPHGEHRFERGLLVRAGAHA